MERAELVPARPKPPVSSLVSRLRAGGYKAGAAPNSGNCPTAGRQPEGAPSLIRREGIDVVFSTGGYHRRPAILAARWCGVPVVLP